MTRRIHPQRFRSWLVGDRIWVRETFNDHCKLVYKADSPNFKGGWTPSIYMPRWASRILLEITELRLEPLQDITIKDIAKEGIDIEDDLHIAFTYKAFTKFYDLWDLINAKRGFSWYSNPQVIVIGFKVLQTERNGHDN